MPAVFCFVATHNWRRGRVIDLPCDREHDYRRSIKLVKPHTSLPRDEDKERPRWSVMHDASPARQQAVASQLHVSDHIHFIHHHGKQVLLLNLSNCSAAEVEKIFRAVPEFVTIRPRGSVLILSDFTGASFDTEAIRVMKETAVFDRPYVKKSAWTGTEGFPQVFSQNVRDFSRREFPVFETRGEALAWLTKE
jgi:hypothetical protein